jgi:two-component system, OmpR family, phosphate regulon sensor histidine kinase PhoR
MDKRRVMLTTTQSPSSVVNSDERVLDGPTRPQRFANGTQELKPLRESARLVEDDIAEIAHDLKSPLGAIALDATLLVERLLNAEKAAGLRSLTRIQQNVAFLDRLVLDLLDACTLVRSELQLERAPTEMSALLDHVIERVAGGARFRVFVDAPQRLVLNVDAHRIERVVANLLDNALKYAPVSTGIVLRLASTATSACVSVIDAGPGIGPDELPHVFDRYRRASTSVGRAGAGLGLYVSKKIVEAHGGIIDVQSVRGAGSRFFFELPR